MGRLGHRADGPRAPGDPRAVGFRARDRAQIDAFWQAGIDAGYRDDGAPGPRTHYGPTYYGGFLLDPDGNSVEAVHGDREDAVPAGRVDHLWIRVRDPQASRRFYTTIAPHAGLRLTHDEPGRVQLSGPAYSFSLVRDERPLTEHVHLAFSAREDATVRAFHAAALAAGYEDHGEPGERAVYTRATTARSCSTRTGTTSRSSITTRLERQANPRAPKRALRSSRKHSRTWPSRAARVS
jgi:catechol 2,3-dioxygenase-like lactoylglutathione lyase family enzyme